MTQSNDHSEEHTITPEQARSYEQLIVQHAKTLIDVYSFDPDMVNAYVNRFKIVDPRYEPQDRNMDAALGEMELALFALGHNFTPVIEHMGERRFKWGKVSRETSLKDDTMLKSYTAVIDAYESVDPMPSTHITAEYRREYDERPTAFGKVTPSESDRKRESAEYELHITRVM